MKQKAKRTGVENKIERVRRSLDAMACGRYPELRIDACCDYIAWLARFHKAPESVWLPLCQKATEILDGGMAV